MKKRKNLRLVLNLGALIVLLASAMLGTTNGQTTIAATSNENTVVESYSPASIQIIRGQQLLAMWKVARSRTKPTATPTKSVATQTPTRIPATATPTAAFTATPIPATATPTVVNTPTPPPSINTPIPTPTLPPNIVTPTPTTVASRGRLVFADEFSGSQLDPSKWVSEFWWGRIASPTELEYYAPDAFDFVSGALRIKAEKRQMGGQNYTSGLISTYNSFRFTYGYAEARIKVPKGQGLWPAFWLLTDNHDSWSEIDVLELLGHEPNRVYNTLHYNGVSGPAQIGSSSVGPDFSQDYHTYAVDWSPTALVWYIDGIERYRLTQNIPNDSMYIISNLAVGGGWPGNPDATTVFPAYCDIDYIRVYQR